MSSLRSALDEMGSEDLFGVSDGDLQEDVVELYAVAERLRAECLRRLRVLDRRRPHEREGFLSTASWLRARTRIGDSTAREHVRVAKTLDTMPLTAEAFSASGITYSHVRVLTRAAAACPDVFEEHEATLVESAATLSVRDLRQLVEVWRHTADREGFDDEAEKLHVQRSVYASTTFQGMVRLDGWLDPENGATVTTALDAVTDPAARAAGTTGDARTPAQRRADALVEICRQFLDQGTSAETGTEKPHLTVTVDLGTLEQRAGRPCELDATGLLTADAARRLACDASLTRIITTGESQPLDVGRKTRTVPAALRRALALRDRTCQFPHCDRPHRWCDAHHIQHWANGGPTSLNNLVLLCRRHHRFVHEHNWTITRNRTTIEITPPQPTDPRVACLEWISGRSTPT